MSRNTKTSGNTFWLTCPKSYQHFPRTACPLGKETALKRLTPGSGCQWFINSEEDLYCFWKYVRNKSDSAGEMTPLEIPEIAKLLGWETSQLEAHANQLLTKLKKLNNFRELFLQ